jgi:hypothetical protein
MRPAHSAAAIILLAALPAAACSDTAGPVTESVGAVVITAPYTELQIGATVQLVATVLDPSGVATLARRVSWSSSHPDIAAVEQVGRVAGIAAGTATIRATAGSVSDSVLIRVVPGPCTAARVTGSIAAGETREHALTANACLLFERHADGWRFEPTEAVRVQIDHMSHAFDALLLVTDLQLNVIAFDDDGGESLNSRLIREFAPGSYLIWATTYEPGETGVYQLVLTTLAPYACADAVGSIALGQSVAGVLDASSCLLDDAHFADPWRFALDRAAVVRIDLTSAEFDTYLIIADASGRWIAEDDDGGAGLNSRLVLSLAAGEYTIWVTTFAPGRTGAYQLAVRPAAAADAAASPTRAAAADAAASPTRTAAAKAFRPAEAKAQR